jgi:hypothetical protein
MPTRDAVVRRSLTRCLRLPTVLERSRQRILASLGETDFVLDVGGGARPFERADWVIDVMSYRERGLYGYEQDATGERFTAETWIERDMCDREPWPFTDGQIDFAVCSHTLEDVRDPVWVCSELVRVARAGYIEVPSRLEEQSYGFQGPWAGWAHHRWLIDLEDDRLTFVLKHHVLHARDSDHFPPGFRDQLGEEQRVLTLFWRGGFQFGERIFLEAASLDAYLADFVSGQPPPTPPGTGGVGGRVERFARGLWRRRPRRSA